MIYTIGYEDMMPAEQGKIRKRGGNDLLGALLMGLGTGLSTMSQLLPYYWILKQLNTPPQEKVNLPALPSFTGTMPLYPSTVQYPQPIIPQASFTGVMPINPMSSYYGVAPFWLNLLK